MAYSSLDSPQNFFLDAKLFLLTLGTSAANDCLVGRSSLKLITLSVLMKICHQVAVLGLPVLTMETANAAYEITDFNRLNGVACPCGVARRGLMQDPAVPYSLHLTSIQIDAKRHYHRRITETYFILQCEPDAYMELNDEQIPVHPEMAITIRPGTWHRAVGQMKVVIVASPKFDPADEWLV